MPTLDEQGHIPEQTLFALGHKAASEVCGVPAADFDRRHDVLERIHELREELSDATDEYMNALGCELERMPWGRRKDVERSGERFSVAVASFTATASEARGLIEGSH